MPADMDSFNSGNLKVCFKGIVKGEETTVGMDSIQLVQPDSSAKKFAVQVGCTEKVVVGEHNQIYRLKSAIEGGGAVNPNPFFSSFNPVGSVFYAQYGNGIQPRYLAGNGDTFNFKLGGTFLHCEEMVAGCTTETAAFGIEPNHIEAAGSANILLFCRYCLFHVTGLPKQVQLYKKYSL